MVDVPNVASETPAPNTSEETKSETAAAPVAVAPKSPSKKASKKAVKTPAKKTVVKKSTKAPAKKAAAPRAKKEGLRKPQIRILAALNKANKPLTRAQIADKAPVDVATCVEYIGSHDEAVRHANDKKHFPSLLTLKLVKFGPAGEEGTVVYEISASGKAALAKANA